jgi:hypothetical protein
VEESIISAEAAEMRLSSQGTCEPAMQRKASGSYYTPSDVAGHFWDLFFRHHKIEDLASLMSFISLNDLVEPAAVSGMFVFSFLRKAASLGAAPENLAKLRFHVIDINFAALRFFVEQIHRIEAAAMVDFGGIRPQQNDFLEWNAQTSVGNTIFVGNPPFINNPQSSRWRNLYADFLVSMLECKLVKGISLILPLSICFSRDYAELRSMIRKTGFSVSASSYDNIPDCLFKAGKPDSANTNRANSQRCTILNLGGPNTNVYEASALISWSVRERAGVLSSAPTFRRIWDGDKSGQIPRPASDEVADYMRNAQGARSLKALLSKLTRPTFAIGGVARNYIGIRDIDATGPGSIPIRPASADDHYIILQIISSKLFYDYWRTYGDGFHVTIDLIERFPVTENLYERFRANKAEMRSVWERRVQFGKEKLNSGKLIKSYDFRAAFQQGS